MPNLKNFKSFAGRQEGKLIGGLWTVNVENVSQEPINQH